MCLSVCLSVCGREGMAARIFHSKRQGLEKIGTHTLCCFSSVYCVFLFCFFTREYGTTRNIIWERDLLQRVVWFSNFLSMVHIRTAVRNPPWNLSDRKMKLKSRTGCLAKLVSIWGRKRREKRENGFQHTPTSFYKKTNCCSWIVQRAGSNKKLRIGLLTFWKVLRRRTRSPITTNESNTNLKEKSRTAKLLQGDEGFELFCIFFWEKNKRNVQSNLWCTLRTS